VIPIFAFQMLRGEPLTVFGDGEQTRDFVNVRDVVRANLAAATTPGVSGAFIGSGSSITINGLIDRLSATTGTLPAVHHRPPRSGDVRDSLADISAARRAIGYAASVGIDDGLSEYIAWARSERTE